MKISDLPLNSTSLKSVPATDTDHKTLSFEKSFRETVRRFPDHIALSDETGTMTYAEMGRMSAAIAGFILERDYGPEAVVGVLCARSKRVLAASFGIMRAGSVFLPVEPELPLFRQEVMLKPASLIITDSANLRLAESFQYAHPGIRHILCLDSPEIDTVLEKGTELSSTTFWEHVAEGGSDAGWQSSFDGQRVEESVLESMAAKAIGKSGLVGKERRRVLDIGSGSGVVSQRLMAASTDYVAVDLARNELDRVEQGALDTIASVYRMEAVDICFLGDDEFDLINLNGVVDNFPGYNYLRHVLNHGVDKLADGGCIYVGSVRDFDKREEFRCSLEFYANEAGDESGLIRFDGSAELFVPEQFFVDWAAASGHSLSVKVSRPETGCAEIDDFRYDVTITRCATQPTASNRIRFGSNELHDNSPELPVIGPSQAAYIVYTSGSTGVPKGVVVEHGNLLHIIDALREYSEGCERVGLVAPLTFDASIQQVALSLFDGKALHVLSDDERKNPENFYSTVRHNRLDVCDMTPTFFNVLVDYLFERKCALPMRRLLLAGEVLRPDVVQKFYSIAGNEHVTLFNVYGPTECTVDSTAYRIDSSNHTEFAPFPMGTPLQGVEISVRDSSGRGVPDSVTGEVWISGGGVSRGYLNSSDATSFVTVDGRRWYRTGDQGFTQNDLVFFMGRADQQVKIRGNRIEIGEVENAIAGFPGVRQVAVVADTFGAQEEKTLAAYVVGDVDGEKLKRYLEQRLPSHCVPGYFVPMMELPLTANRKVDRKALPLPQAYKKESVGRPLSGPMEKQLASIWKTLLGFDVMDADVSFFDVGGHSILAVRLIAMVEKELGVSLTLTELFSNPSIGHLAALFAGKADGDSGPVIQLCHTEGAPVLFLFHPVGGSVFCYSALADLLSHKFTVYAVEAAGFSPERNVLNTELHRVEELAAHYLKEICQVKSGEILFGGWSFGGLLAYEAACTYEAMGKKAGPVILLDSVADNTEAKDVAGKDEVGMLQSLLKDGLDFNEKKLRALPREKKLAYLVECGERTGLLPEGFSPVQMDNLLQTYRCNAIAAARYEKPTRSNKDVLLVRALEMSETSRKYLDDKYQGWSRFVDEGKITLKWTEGTHENMLSPGLVENVATHILEYFDE